MKKYSRNPGRIRIKAAEILRNGGIPVSEYDIYTADGYWRSSPYVDVARWYCLTYKSWQTLTEFVKLASKYGFVVDKKESEIWANTDG